MAFTPSKRVPPLAALRDISCYKNWFWLALRWSTRRFPPEVDLSIREEATLILRSSP
jgi:hypothetical protein